MHLISHIEKQIFWVAFTAGILGEGFLKSKIRQTLLPECQQSHPELQGWQDSIRINTQKNKDSAHPSHPWLRNGEEEQSGSKTPEILVYLETFPGTLAPLKHIFPFPWGMCPRIPACKRADLFLIFFYQQFLEVTMAVLIFFLPKRINCKLVKNKPGETQRGRSSWELCLVPSWVTGGGGKTFQTLKRLRKNQK